MADTTSPAAPGEAAIEASAGHLSVHIDGAPDVKFSFERQNSRMAGAFAASSAIQVSVVLMGVFLAGRLGSSAVTDPFLPDKPNSEIVWLSVPGPGGGGGGGGNKMKEPPRQAELPGKDKLTVPAAKPPSLEVQKPKEEEPDPIAQLNIPAATLASATESLPGAIEAPPGPPSPSLGSGSGGGAGTGQGTGIGSGRGSGLGDGVGGGTGGGFYRPGNGVTLPVVLREVKPQYTSDAMRAKVQGSVTIQAIVRTDGTVGDVSVVRSLDSTFGLDEEAMKAARQWRFRPGTRLGEPVPVIITIELTFTLR
jgi:TonB family protein